MVRMRFVLITGLAALFAAMCLTPAGAQTAPGSPYPPQPRYVPPRIEVTPRPLFYRRCVERLELQNRPSGPVLYPLTYCWWVRG
jgi:hypothetical protein